MLALGNVGYRHDLCLRIASCKGLDAFIKGFDRLVDFLNVFLRVLQPEKSFRPIEEIERSALSFSQGGLSLILVPMPINWSEAEIGVILTAIDVKKIKVRIVHKMLRSGSEDHGNSRFSPNE